METGSKSDAAKRRQPQHTGGPGLGFGRSQTLDRQPGLSPFDRELGGEALYWQHRVAPLYE